MPRYSKAGAVSPLQYTHTAWKKDPFHNSNNMQHDLHFRTMEIYRKPMVVFNRVDRYCRRLFPLAFLAANIFYMYWYEYTIWG